MYTVQIEHISRNVTITKRTLHDALDTAATMLLWAAESNDTFCISVYEIDAASSTVVAYMEA